MTYHEDDPGLDDGNFEQHLAALPVPPMPADLAAHCRRLVAANDATATSGTRNGRSSRFILLGTAVMVAAAAALLVRQPGTAPQRSSQVGTPMSQPVMAPGIPSADAVSAVAPKERPAEPKRKPSAPTPQPRPFTVRVQPLQNEGRDLVTRSSIEQFHAALLNGLRAIPGLTLIAPDSTGYADDAPADFRLTVKGSGPMLPDTWDVEVMAKAAISASDGRTAQTATLWKNQGGSNGAGCDSLSGPAPKCTDPASVAAAQIDGLRKILFPPDPSLQRELQTRLLDRGLDPAERFRALSDLRSPRMAVSGTPAGALRVGLSELPVLDDAVLRGALDLATTAPDPAMRAAVWSSLRGSRHPGLVLPLIESLRHDTGEDVRLQAATTLAADFAEDPRVRDAFNTVAKDEPRQITRMVAQRALSGDTVWDEYVTSTLKDTARTESQRLEPLAYLRQSNRQQDLRRVLDDEAMVVVAELLPRSWIDPASVEMAARLFGNLAYYTHPAMRQLAIDSLHGNAPAEIRSTALNALRSRALNDPDVHAALSKMATDDPLPYLRLRAAEALQPKAGSTASAPAP